MTQAILSVLKWALMACLSVLVVLVSIQVIFRQLGITGSFGWTEEASRGLFVWMVMLGAALGVAESTHFSIGSIARKLPDRLRRAAQLLKTLCMASVALIFLVHGWHFAERGLARVSLVTGLPLTWTFSAVFTSGLLMCVFLAVQLRRRNGLADADKPAGPGI